MRIFLDESVVQDLAQILRAEGHEVLTVTDWGGKGTADEDIWPLVTNPPTLLVTRDHHFTAGVRFDPALTLGIVYLRHGNLTAVQEIDLVTRFLRQNPLETYKGRLVTLSPHFCRIR